MSGALAVAKAQSDGKRVTVRLRPETYGGLVVLKLEENTSLERLVEEACALLIASRAKDIPS